jgi:hypothetical protein
MLSSKRRALIRVLTCSFQNSVEDYEKGTPHKMIRNAARCQLTRLRTAERPTGLIFTNGRCSLIGYLCGA